MSRVGVFAFPTSLDFFLEARQTHKQLLTLYNPYDFAVDFAVLSTSPHKFTVVEPEGTIAPLSCVDVVIRYTQPSQSHCGNVDKFRITMQERKASTNLGKRDIVVRFHHGEPDSTPAESAAGESFQPIAIRGTTPPKQDRIICNHPAHGTSAPNVIALCIALACISALLLPTQREPPSESPLPEYLHLSVNVKLVFSFVLGLVSMVVIKP